MIVFLFCLLDNLVGRNYNFAQPDLQNFPDFSNCNLLNPLLTLLK
jgi:hypothetical protein